MKRLFWLSISLLVSLVGCHKEIVNVSTPETVPQTDKAEITYETEFLTDYVINGRDREKGRPSDIEWAIYDVLGASSPKVLDAKFEEIQQRLHALVGSHPPGKMNHVVQRVYLKYLREVYLPNQSAESISKIVEILAELMPTGPMDLDVIADAYYAVRDNLSDEVKNQYFAVIMDLYQTDKAYLFEEAERVKTVYDSTTVAEEKGFALMRINQLKRRSEALAYVDDKYALGRVTNRK